MSILNKVHNYKSAKTYKKYRKTPCSKCGILNWKYSYTPYIKKGKKCVLEARICSNCGHKDTNGHFILDKAKLNDNLNFNITK